MNKKIIICVVGLGYVGLPLARLFSKRYRTIGYDNNPSRIKELASAGEDNIIFTDRTDDIKECNFYIVAVPTPVDTNNRPDLSALIQASETIGTVISKDDIVVYESTVYPGVTEEECIPRIEEVSGMKLNTDFYAGYSPERINPGDHLHSVENIIKVTSGSTDEAADLIDNVYRSALKNGTYKVSSIKVAEASKIIENAQRDVNIAFINELAKIFNAMDIDTKEVIEAASTKWNFIKMCPGLVGGHCISVDPYYLIQKAQVYGVLPRIMMEARRLNDGMGEYVAGQVIKTMNKKGLVVKDAKILLLGFSFKENCPDIRNTKVADIYTTFSEYTKDITIYDPICDKNEVEQTYKIKIQNQGPESLTGLFDVVVLCVAHDAFRGLDIRGLLNSNNGVVYDVKGVLNKKDIDGRL